LKEKKKPLEINETSCITYPKEQNAFQIRNEEDDILLIAQTSNNEYREEWMYWINKVVAFDREKYEKTQSYRKLKEETKKSKTEDEIKELTKNNKENVPNSNKKQKENQLEKIQKHQNQMHLRKCTLFIQFQKTKKNFQKHQMH